MNCFPGDAYRPSNTLLLFLRVHHTFFSCGKYHKYCAKLQVRCGGGCCQQCVFQGAGDEGGCQGQGVSGVGSPYLWVVYICCSRHLKVSFNVAHRPAGNAHRKVQQKIQKLAILYRIYTGLPTGCAELRVRRSCRHCKRCYAKAQQTNINRYRPCHLCHCTLLFSCRYDAAADTASDAYAKAKQTKDEAGKKAAGAADTASAKAQQTKEQAAEQVNSPRIYTNASWK